ncbi:MAG: HAMP domain-containing histidine kinase, partial [Hyphomicrobiales bacterium]|nr:HAMP domain-containing histidine kinase [Hyphomicrobiales bacterium]
PQAELAAEETDPERQREIVARIHRRSIGLSRLTDQLLSRALVIHRAEAAVQERLDLRAVAIGTAEESDHELYGRPADLHLDLPEDPVFVRGDMRSLVEACKNLVNNAFRYGIPPVTLRVGQDGSEACIAVDDHGSGLPEDQWSKSVRRFARTRYAAPESAGLGLSIASAVARAQGGELRFEKTADGFSVALVLPRDKGDER